MENVMTNGFTELSNDELIGTDGGFILSTAAVIAIVALGGAEILTAAGVKVWSVIKNNQSAKISAECEQKLRWMGYAY